MNRFCSTLIAVLLVGSVAAAQQRPEPVAPPTIATKIAGLKSFPGYFNFYWDENAGKVWLEIEKWGDEFLYVNSLPAGVGSNDIGLDRGQLGGARVVRFERSGPKVLLTQSNYEFRAITDNPDERRAVRDSFAESVLWGFDVAAEEYTDLVKRGVIDPAKVTRSACENAVSIAGMILTTEALVTEVPEKHDHAPQMPDY